MKNKTFIASYRPVSALPTISRVFERIKNNVAKITDYIGKIFAPFLHR